MGFQCAELRGEVLLLHRRDVLIAKEQDFVLQPQRSDFGNDVRIQCGIRQADVAELCTDGGRANFHFDLLLEYRWPDNSGRRGGGW